MESGSASHENNLPAPQNEQSRSPARGRAQIGAGYFLITMGIIIGFFGFGALRPNSNKEIWIYIVGAALAFVAACVLSLAATLLRRGRKHLVPVLPLDAVPAGDFVLYLRAFTDDIKFTEVKVSNRGTASSPVLAPVPRTEEEQIRDAVLPFGPLIAVGRPGEPLPELGAQRGYLRHDSWQGTVLAMMRAAHLVLLSAGLSQGLHWELTQAIANVPPERLVLIIPMDHQEYSQFRQQLSHCFPQGLPPYPEGKTVKYSEKIRGVIYFNPDWDPAFARFDLESARGNKIRTIESHFVYGLQPVYQKLGAPWPGVENLPLLPTAVPQYWPLRRQLTRYYVTLAFSALFTLGSVVFVSFALVSMITSG